MKIAKWIAGGCAGLLLACGGIGALGVYQMLGWPPAAYGPLSTFGRPMVLVDGMVFDGRELHPGWDVVIDGSTLTCVAETCEVPEGAAVWDVKGRLVMPGLIDAHVHWLFAEHGLLSFNAGSPQTRRAYLEAGVTTVRSLGDTPHRVSQQHALAESGAAGPRFIASSPIFTATGGHPMNMWAGMPAYMTDAAIEVDDADDARRLAQEAIDDGAAGLKIVYDDGDGSFRYPRMDRTVLAALIEVGHQNDVWVAVHAQEDAEVRAAVELGADSIEHGFIWDEPTEETLTLLADSDVVVVPTMGALEHFAESFGTDVLTKIDAALPGRVAAMQARGIRLGVGSDNQYGMTQGKATLHEMDLMVAAGVPILDVLRGATSINASAMHRDDIGVLRTGAVADVLVVDAGTLESLKGLRRPMLVLSKGTVAVDRR